MRNRLSAPRRLDPALSPARCRIGYELRALLISPAAVGMVSLMLLTIGAGLACIVAVLLP